jgi:hypothetical protein
VEPVTRGDPESPLRWTSKSLNTLAGELTAEGHPVSDDTVRRLLAGQGFSLQANAKTLEASRHPDRDAQFHHINEQVKAALTRQLDFRAVLDDSADGADLRQADVERVKGPSVPQPQATRTRDEAVVRPSARRSPVAASRANGHPLDRTRTSHLARLELALAA